MALGTSRKSPCHVSEAAASSDAFRVHASWFDEETYAVLRGRGAALCLADVDAPEDGGEPLPSDLVPTASWGFFIGSAGC